MNNKEKILKLLSSLIEKGILTSGDVKNEILTNFKFKKEDIIGKLQLVSKEEHEVLKKVVLKLEKEILKLKKKNYKGKDIFICKPSYVLLPRRILPPCELIMSSAIESPRPTPDLFKLLLLSNL